MKQPHILSVGEVLWYLFPEGALFGGAPANFACHAALQDAEVTKEQRMMRKIKSVYYLSII